VPELKALTCRNCGAPLTEDALQGTRFVCPYCGQTHAFKEDPGEQQRGGAFAAGDAVLIEWRSRWWDGTVLKAEGPQAWRVHYEGWGSDWDEIVGPERLARRPGAPAAPPAEAKAATESGSLSVGSKVSVQWDGRWFPATILAVEGPGRYRIHYDGWGSDWDEVVGPDRMDLSGKTSAPSAPPPGEPGYRTGARVSINWNGSWYDGTVIAVEGPERYRVHYEGWSADSDEVVGPERLRAGSGGGAVSAVSEAVSAVVSAVAPGERPRADTGRSGVVDSVIGVLRKL